jgi:hypothetical protein
MGLPIAPDQMKQSSKPSSWDSYLSAKLDQVICHSARVCQTVCSGEFGPNHFGRFIDSFACLQIPGESFHIGTSGL